MGTTPAPESPSGPLAILLSCPQCGAPSTVDDDTRSATCGHCGSFLVVERPGRDEIFLAESVVAGVEEVRRIVIAYRLQARRAELLARYSTESDGERVSVPEMILEAELRRFEEALLERVRIVEAHRIEAPYWHLSGSILQAILGRHHDGPKEVRLRAFAVEHTVPAYDARAVNLRDRGLRLSRARVRPLSRRARSERGPFLPWVDVPQEAHREIGRWRTRNLDPGTEPVVKRGDLAFARRFLVYRQYWLARVMSDREQSWVMIDAGFATIGGYPGEVEVREILGRAVADPEDAESRETKAVARPSRCPDCGFEATFAARTLMAVCRNCQLGVEPRADGIHNVGYDHVDPAWDGPTEYLPFWAFPARLAVQGTAHPVVHLEEYGRLLFPRGAPPGFFLRGDLLFVPAFRLLGTEEGDECFQRLAQWIHGAPPRIEAGKVPLGRAASFRDAAVAETDARETLPMVLYGLHGRPSAARLNTLLVRRLVDGVRVEAAPGRIVLLPFAPTDAGLVAPDAAVVVPGPLLDGGPAVEARRVTVYRPAGPAPSTA
jgi:DNA-directed RNA polymerase subunit RPC12/RpoP